MIDIDNLTKTYGIGPHAYQALRGVTAMVEANEFFTLLGPSGCGKTTLLRMIAGFETPTTGRLVLDGQDVSNSPPFRRPVNTVFQSYALFPHMTCAENIGFGLRMLGKPKAEITRTVAEMLELVQMTPMAHRLPTQLSGGQQQRIALARALAPKPKVLLLDEPLSALDAKVRVGLRDDIRAIQRELGITAIFVTHDQEEALSISDRVVVMHQGRADQIGTPSEIYNRPATRFVASFVGHLNTFDARMESDASVAFAGRRFPPMAQLRLLASGAPVAGPVTVALRPEALSLRPRQPGDLAIEGRVLNSDFLGSVIRARVDVGGQPVSIDMFNQTDAVIPQPGAAADLYFSPDDLLILPK